MARIIDGVVYKDGDVVPGSGLNIVRNVKNLISKLIAFLLLFFRALFSPPVCDTARTPGRSVIRTFRAPPSCGPGA